MKKSNSSNTQLGFGHLGVVFALVVAIAVSAIGFKIINANHRKPATAALKHITVQLNWLHNAQFAGLYTAVEKGYYKQAGLDVTLKETADNTDPNQEVSAGRADFAISTPMEVILARDRGYSVKALAAIQQTSPLVIVSRADAHIQTPYDFTGKVLGRSGDNPEAKVTYAALLASAGVPATAATQKNIDFDIVKVFESHEADTADIYRTDQTYLLKQANISYNLLYPEQYGFAIYGDVLVTTDAKIKNDSHTVQAFVRASLQGWSYAVDHQADALTYTAKYQNSLYKDPAYEKYVLAQETPLIKPTGGQNIGSMQYIPWNRAYQGVQASGLLTKPTTASENYTTQFID